jgi:hypothetical protein
MKYQTDYLNIINVIAEANAQLANVTALEAAIAALESTATSTNVTLNGLEGALVGISDALQVIDTNLTTAGTAVNNTQVLLTQVDGIATALASTTTSINATLVALQTLTANQTARLADHELRIAALEAVPCQNVVVSNHVAGEFTAGEDLTAGQVAALSRGGEAVSAAGLYIKDAYQLSPEALGEDEIFSIKTVPIDSSDHFYSVYQLNANSVSTFTVDGVTYNREYTVVVKYSPAHEVVWVATARYPSVGRSAFISPILSGLEVQSLTLDENSNDLLMSAVYYGDDEDSQVDFFNADGRYSGFTTPRFSPAASGEEQRGACFALLTSSGEWKNIALTDHSGVTEIAEITVFGAISLGNRKIFVTGFAYSVAISGATQTVLFPGGFSVTIRDSIRTAAYYGVFNLDTFQFEYVVACRVDGLQDFFSLSPIDVAVDASAQSVFLLHMLRDRNDNLVPTVTITYPAVNGPNITLSLTGSTGSSDLNTLLLAKIDAATGGVFWVSASETESDNPSDIRSTVSGVNGRFSNSDGSLVVDHYDRPWIAVQVVDNGGASGVSFTWDGVTAASVSTAERAFVLFRFEPSNGNVLSAETFDYNYIGAQENRRFEATTFVIDSAGDLFLALRFNGEELTIDGTTYATPGQASTTIVKLRGHEAPEIVVEYVYFDDYSELSFAIDSHDNIWAFLHENTPVVGDVDTFGITGIGIVKLGQLDIEPLGIVAADALQGQTARIVYSGEVEYVSPVAWGVGRNLYNNHGTLTPDNVYGKTRVAVVLNGEQLLVDAHRARITETVR